MAEDNADDSQTVALILSFFIAGLGQIYQGRTKEGIVFLVAMFISGALTLVLIGFILIPIVWIVNMYDAYTQWLEL
jgi:TM2 domain-containing membrane protein YozV